MKNDWQILAALIRNYHESIRHPRISAKLLFVSQVEDERLRFVFRALLLADGNWEQARQMILAKFGALNRPEWLTKLLLWVENIRAKKVCALLPEKCGGES